MFDGFFYFCVLVFHDGWYAPYIVCKMNVHVVEVNRAWCTFIFFNVISKTIHLKCETISMVVSFSCGSCLFKFYGGSDAFICWVCLFVHLHCIGPRVLQCDHFWVVLFPRWPWWFGRSFHCCIRYIWSWSFSLACGGKGEIFSSKTGLFCWKPIESYELCLKLLKSCS